ncbi:hypothetical protein BURMUCF2_0665 [Burkholderia multivorans CF2]|nr:hypothetical protein BURMUCF2_0665 [Burkholderia multivorans CF2]
MRKACGSGRAPRGAAMRGASNCNLQQMDDTRGAGFRYIACMRRARPPLPTGAHK